MNKILLIALLALAVSANLLHKKTKEPSDDDREDEAAIVACFTTENCEASAACIHGMVDADGDGRVKANEIVAMFNETHEEASEKIAECDTDGDYGVSQEELIECMCNNDGEDSGYDSGDYDGYVADSCWDKDTCEEGVSCHYDELDANHDGKVTV